MKAEWKNAEKVYLKLKSEFEGGANEIRKLHCKPVVDLIVKAGSISHAMEVDGYSELRQRCCDNCDEAIDQFRDEFNVGARKQLAELGWTLEEAHAWASGLNGTPAEVMASAPNELMESIRRLAESIGLDTDIQVMRLPGGPIEAA